MMEFYVSGQSLKFYSPVLAADSLDYLTAKLHFSDDEWQGASCWLHFRQGEGPGALVYDLQLDENGELTQDKHLNLSIGQWEVYLTGTRGDTRLTTVPVIITVKKSGLIDAPLHELPMSVAEQVDYNARQALLLAGEVKQKADSGAFDGASFVIKGYYESVEELMENVPEPVVGDVYGVGTGMPYSIYVWDQVGKQWKDNGSVQGVQGEAGKDGAVFVPHVDASGNISWSNDGGLTNPERRNIMGPKGDKGDRGDNGKSPYQLAREQGYTGTEAGFNQAISAFPYHNERHMPQGGDPLRLLTDNYSDASVTARKLAANAVSRLFIVRVGTDWSGNAAPYTQNVTVDGMPESERIFADIILSDDWAAAELENAEYAKLVKISARENGITVYAAEPTELALNLKLIAIHGDGMGEGESSGAGGGVIDAAQAEELLFEMDFIPAVMNDDGRLLSDSAGRIVLRY